MSTLKPPIFLIGNVRSGTTMLMRYFGLHPEVVSWNEPRTIWRYAAPRRKHDRFDASDATPKVVRCIRRQFLKYQKRHADRRVMEKTPSNVLRIPYVHAVFPECRMVYVVRHPFSQLSSAELRSQKRGMSRSRLWQRLRETPKSQLHYYAPRLVSDFVRKKILKPKYTTLYGVLYPGIHEDRKRMSPEEIMAMQWAHCSRQAEEDLSKLPEGTVFRIRYEDFVASPVEHFRRILAHFDLELTSEMAEEIGRETDSGRQDKWRRLDPEILRKCVPILDQEMQRHGYELPEELPSSPAAAPEGR
jgi:hypothetical protein